MNDPNFNSTNFNDPGIIAANAKLKKNAAAFARNRGTLAAIAGITLINIALIFFGSDWYLLFSATLPWHFMIIAMMDVPTFGYDATTIVFIALALGGVFIYFLLWLLSGRWRWIILLGTIIFALDTIYLVFLIIDLSLYDSFDAGFLLDVGFQVLIMIYLIAGTVNWIKLRGVSHEQYNQALAGENAEELTSNLNELSEGVREENDENKGDR